MDRGRKTTLGSRPDPAASEPIRWSRRNRRDTDQLVIKPRAEQRTDDKDGSLHLFPSNRIGGEAAYLVKVKPCRIWKSLRLSPSAEL